MKMVFLRKLIWDICSKIYRFSYEVFVLTIFCLQNTAEFTVVNEKVVSLTTAEHIHKQSNLSGHSLFCIHLVYYNDLDMVHES